VPIQIATLPEAPRFRGGLGSLADDGWPAFMREDPVADLYYAVAEQDYRDFVLVAWDDADPGTLAARAFCVPFAFGDDAGRPTLPDGGWDQVIRWAWLDRLRERTPTHLSALEISIDGSRRGTGLSSRMLEAMQSNGRRLGYSHLFAPVRPSAKSAETGTLIGDYVARTRPDGLPVDPWLRVHVRAGGEIVRIASRSMTISGTVEEWRAWTGQEFATSGDVEVPGALLPVHCSVENDHVVYVEPNVWVHHRLRP
jgi:hypothetical protein